MWDQGHVGGKVRRGVLRRVVCAVAVICAACGGIRPDRSQTAIKTFLSGWATISCRWPCEWGIGTLAFGSGMEVAAGDRVHVSKDRPSYLELSDDRSLTILGPDTTAALETASIYRSITRTRLRLDNGGVYAAIDEPPGQGYLEVKTPVGTVALDEAASGSAMIVGVDADAGITRVACIRGSVTMQAGRTSITLSPGTSIALTQKRSAQRIEAFEGQPPETDPLLWQVATRDREP